MNYGKYGLKKQMREISSRPARIANKIRVICFKLFLISLLLIGVGGVILGIRTYRAVIAESPDISTLDMSPSASATIIYDAKGNEIQTLVMAGSNRELVEYSQIPKNLVNAFVAIEDARFWTHNGIDLKGMLRAVVSGVLTGHLDQGASTITQQLLKNAVFNGGSEDSWRDRIVRKLQEQYLAIELEKRVSKEEILEDYLNTINLGANTLGVEAASQRYFGKSVSDLTLCECAVIAAITQNPSRYNPITHPEENEKRRNTVLDNMWKEGKISEEELTAAKSEDVYSRIQTVDEARSEISSIYSYFVDEVIVSVLKDLEKAGYSDSDARTLLYSGGLRIYTTQDPDIQAIVDEEMSDPENYDNIEKYGYNYRLKVSRKDGSDHTYTDADVRKWLRREDEDAAVLFASEKEVKEMIEEYKKAVVGKNETIVSESLTTSLQPQGSCVVMDQSTGQVIAINGGRGEKLTSLSLNRATDTTRQPGSTFKVLTAFAPALDSAGATLGTVYYDSPFSVDLKEFKNWWTTTGYVGYSNIRHGIIYSMNIIALKCLVNTVTPEVGFQYALDFGITSLEASKDIGAPLCLGGITYGVSNLELTAAYAAIANKGVYIQPVYYTKILDRTGKVILNNEPETHTVIKESTAWLLTNAMEDVCKLSYLYDNRGIRSSAPQAKVNNLPTAGKSGTTTDINDVWFVGYTPYYTIGVWEGYDENGNMTTGENVKNIFHNIMERATEGLPAKEFAPMPSNIETASICSKSGKLAIPGICDQDPAGNYTYTEYFVKGTTPTEVCDHHTKVTICKETGELAGELCPEEQKEEKIYRIVTDPVPANTADTQYMLPQNMMGKTCSLHTEEWLKESESASIAEEESKRAESESALDPLGPSVPGGSQESGTGASGANGSGSSGTHGSRRPGSNSPTESSPAIENQEDVHRFSISDLLPH